MMKLRKKIKLKKILKKNLSKPATHDKKSHY